MGSSNGRSLLRGLLIATLAFAAAPAMAEAEAPDEAKLELGRTVFLERAQPACGICHTLADAGTEGAIGPVLDDLRPTVEIVTRAVTQGIGPMRPYTDLSEEEIDALAHYVAHVTGAE